jgi:integrase
MRAPFRTMVAPHVTRTDLGPGRVIGSVEDRAYVEPKRQTVATFLQDTLLPAIENTIKPSTFESYRRWLVAGGWWLLATTGMRHGEVLGLRLDGR